MHVYTHICMHLKEKCSIPDTVFAVHILHLMWGVLPPMWGNSNKITYI